MTAVATNTSKLQSLKDIMSCDMSDCPSGQHCFRKLKNGKLPFSNSPAGDCQACGKKGVVDWERVRQRDWGDIENTIQELQKECVRYHYWNLIEISEGAINHARRKGRIEMRKHTEKTVRNRLGAAENPGDGYWVRWESNDAVNYARHATATCCRNCIQYWHGIEAGRALSEGEIQYLVDLLMRYIESKITLTELGEVIPHRRRSRHTLSAQVQAQAM